METVVKLVEHQIPKTLTCPECKKVLKNRRAFAGHMWLSHQKRPGWKWELQKQVAQSLNEVAKLKAELSEAQKTAQMHDMQLGLNSLLMAPCKLCGQPLYDHRRANLQGGGGIALMCK